MVSSPRSSYRYLLSERMALYHQVPEAMSKEQDYNNESDSRGDETGDG
jgi:hypothetical protein